MESKPKVKKWREDYELVQIIAAQPGWRAWYKIENDEPAEETGNFGGYVGPGEAIPKCE